MISCSIQKSYSVLSNRRTGPVTPMTISGIPENKAKMTPEIEEQINVSETPISLFVISPNKEILILVSI